MVLAHPVGSAVVEPVVAKHAYKRGSFSVILHTRFVDDAIWLLNIVTDRHQIPSLL